MSEPDSTVDAPRVRRPAGAARKRRVVGRGSASGHGGTSGRGTKGQRARAGSGVRPTFEGGQMPLYRRIARRGFSNHPFRNVHDVLDVRDLNRFADGATVDRQALLEAGMIGSAGVPVKLLGSGKSRTCAHRTHRSRVLRRLPEGDSRRRHDPPDRCRRRCFAR